MSKQNKNTRKRKISSLLLMVFVLFVVGWILAYYANLIGESRADSGQSTQDLLEHYVHPDISQSAADMPFPAEGKYCLACHQGIEPARPIGSKMMQQILEKAHRLRSQRLRCLSGGTPSELHNKDRHTAEFPKEVCWLRLRLFLQHYK